MSRIGVLGVGSSHGDDQLGWCVIDQLQEIVAGASLEKVSNPGAALLNRLMEFDQVVIVDACDKGLAVGEVVEYAPEEIRLLQKGSLSSHFIGVAESLALAESLSVNLPDIRLFLMQKGDCQPMAELSHEVKQSLPRLCLRIQKYLKESGCGV